MAGSPDTGAGLAAIVLAAGMARRMGRPKLLLPLGNGTVLDAVLRNFEACDRVTSIIVVTGFGRQDVEAVVCRYAKASCVHNPEYGEGGMLSSVQAGIAALPSGIAGFFLALGDQPLVRRETIRALADAFDDACPAVVAPEYGGRRGHPVLFAAACAESILALHPCATLKDAVAAHEHGAMRLPVEDPSILFDIDTPADYEAAVRMAAQFSSTSLGDSSHA